MPKQNGVSDDTTPKPNTAKRKSIPDEVATVKEKRDVACPPHTSVTDFLATFALVSVRKVVSIKLELKVGLYFMLIIIGSVLLHVRIIPLPSAMTSTFLLTLNRALKAFGWGWILFVGVVFMYISNNILVSRRSGPSTDNGLLFQAMIPTMARLFIATVVWYVVTKVYMMVHQAGVCRNIEGTALRLLSDHKQCVKAGNVWAGADISGHVFLIVWSNIVLLEELAVLRLTDRVLANNRNSPHRWQLVAATLLASLTVILYDLMLVVSVIYYHTLLEKLLSFAITSAAWVLLYKTLYPKLEMQPGAGITV